MEINKEVKIIEVHFKCDKCGDGFLRPTGLCLTSNPPRYPHKCTHCDYSETFVDITYPYNKMLN